MKPVIFVWPGNEEGRDRIIFACDLSGRYNPYPMVEPVVRETKFC
jgi:hypothetical protein